MPALPDNLVMGVDRTGQGRRKRVNTVPKTYEIEPAGRKLMFRTQPGIFSEGEPDEGTMLLLERVLPQVKPHQTVLDLGTGVGIIGLSIAGLLVRGEVWMVDSDIRAVRLAEENMRLNSIENAHVVLGDVTRDLPKMRFDLVVSNPPTHSGRAVLASFIAESYDVLRPGGSLYIVVNRLLSAKEMMTETFGNVREMARHKGFIVLESHKERRVVAS
jgi:16S rRNA (guanine1207-N2)-methyltransferase